LFQYRQVAYALKPKFAWRSNVKTIEVKIIPKTIGVDRSASKWIGRARVAGADYEAGVRAPKVAWSTAAAGAADTFFSAVSSPDSKTLFLRGIRRAGDARWSDMALKKGVNRFPQGVEMSEAYYRSQMGDVLGQIETVSLASRGPRGAAQNYNRVKDIGDKLHAWRLAKRAAGS